jgi:type I restriction enzyme S subunit
MEAKYKCENCDYTTNRKNDFSKHKKRKVPCVGLPIDDYVKDTATEVAQRVAVQKVKELLCDTTTMNSQNRMTQEERNRMTEKIKSKLSSGESDTRSSSASGSSITRNGSSSPKSEQRIPMINMDDEDGVYRTPVTLPEPVPEPEKKSKGKKSKTKKNESSDLSESNKPEKKSSRKKKNKDDESNLLELINEEKNAIFKEKDLIKKVMKWMKWAHDLYHKAAIKKLKSNDVYKDLSYLLFLKFLPDLIDSKIPSLKDINYYKDNPKVKPYMMQLLSLEKLIDQGVDLFGEQLNSIMEHVLGYHENTKELFENVKLNADYRDTFEVSKVLITNLKDVKLSNMTLDVKNIMHEHLTNKYAQQGKEFSQFLTPAHLIKLLLKLQTTLFPDFNPKNIYDPTIGCGSLVLKACKLYNIDASNIYGREIDKDIYQKCCLNMLLLFGELPKGIKLGNGYSNNTDEKYDYIISNPPFNGDVNFKDVLFDSNNVDDKPENNFPYKIPKKNHVLHYKNMYLYGISSDESTSSFTNEVMFLQHCLYKLPKEGVLNIIMSQGEWLFTTSKPEFISFRKFLVENFNLVAMILAPSNVFANAGSKTCVLYIKNNGPTQKISIYETDKKCIELNLVSTLLAKTMNKKNYSLLYKNYLEQKLTKDYEFKTIGELCEIKGGKFISNDISVDKLYPVYGGGDVSYYYNEYNRDGLNIKFGRTGINEKNFIQIIEGKYWLLDKGYTIHSKKIYEKFLFHWINNIRNEIYNILSGGQIQQGITIPQIKSIKVPIPPPEEQVQIGDVAHSLYQHIKKLEKLIEETKEIKRTFIYSYPFNKVTIFQHKLGNIVNIVRGPKHNVSEGKDEGKYPLLCSSTKEKVKWLDKYDYENYYIIIGMGGEFNIHYKKEFSISTDMIVLESKQSTIYRLKYIYYFMRYSSLFISKLYAGQTIEHLTIEKLFNIDIYTPSLWDQDKIIQELESQETQMDNAIKEYENMIKLYTGMYNNAYLKFRSSNPQ